MTNISSVLRRWWLTILDWVDPVTGYKSCNCGDVFPDPCCKECQGDGVTWFRIPRKL